jgi:hypothetical protein
LNEKRRKEKRKALSSIARNNIGAGLCLEKRGNEEAKKRRTEATREWRNEEAATMNHHSSVRNQVIESAVSAGVKDMVLGMVLVANEERRNEKRFAGRCIIITAKRRFNEWARKQINENRLGFGLKIEIWG